ncbi:GNAT family N-acetyltransferase [Olivibacter sp. SDN3]|uniref:GNAT family N-acetyltransferase n=1 Tax=Olivibacter sp. SDN3 TaxID=2764720 RepID=UPI001651ACAC|nr:GNAT family N-acetyltransferase [Olivibacter sp. SDN3]QNL48115.1 GNAT family N-acetyltransferase [Olivibacter sp. SDN3]
MERNFYISTDKSLIDIEMVYNFLSMESYWAEGRSKDVIAKSIENSFCFAVFNTENQQIAFARVITDYAVFAWLLDVFVLDAYRNKGVGKMLMTAITQHEELKNVPRWRLATRDAHGLYKKYGFKALAEPDSLMEKSSH